MNLYSRVTFGFSWLVVVIVLIVGLVFARMEYGDAGFVPQSVSLGE